MVTQAQARPRYPSALPEDPGALGAPVMPPATSGPRGGPPRQGDMRDVLTPLCSRHRGGCPWALRPQDFLPTSTVSDSVAPWREPTPSVACLARQAVKTTELGGPERGEDGGQHIKGRKRHLWVDPWGWVRAVLITSARRAEGGAAPLLLSHVTPQDLPRRVTICAEQQSHHQAREA